MLLHLLVFLVSLLPSISCSLYDEREVNGWLFQTSFKKPSDSAWQYTTLYQPARIACKEAGQAPISLFSLFSLFRPSHKNLETRLLLGWIGSLLVKLQRGLLLPLVADPKPVPELGLVNSDVSQ